MQMIAHTTDCLVVYPPVEEERNTIQHYEGERSVKLESALLFDNKP